MSLRVPLVTPGTDPALAEIEARITAERGRISPLYRTLLNSPPVADGWERLLTAIRNKSSVPGRLRELAILRVAVLNGVQLEFDAHAPHALRAGLSQAKIDAVRAVQVDPVFDGLERAVLALTDEMTRNVRVDEAVYDAVRVHFEPRALVELVATVAAYNMVARLLEALEIRG